MSTSTPLLRLATPIDLAAINAIYNHYVQHSTCTYQTQPETEAARLAWFQRHGPKHPVTVVELDGQIAGWGSLSPYHPREAYAATVENSVYIKADLHRRGLGRTVLEDLIRRAREFGHHTIIAGIDAEQTASIVLHQRCGFTEAGRLKQAGFKFGRWLDIVYLQLML